MAAKTEYVGTDLPEEEEHRAMLVAPQPRGGVPAIAHPSPVSFAEFVKQFATDDAIKQQQELMAAYDRACSALIGENDVQEEGGKQFKKKSAWRKLGRFFQITIEPYQERGWWETDPETGVRHYVHEVTVIGVAPWGQRIPAMGSCSTRESRFYTMGPACPSCGGAMWDNRNDRSDDDFKCKNRQCQTKLFPGEWKAEDVGRIPNMVARMKAEHDCRATACTRANNRAVSDLVAMGEVSAEELDFDGHGGGDPYTGRGGQDSGNGSVGGQNGGGSSPSTRSTASRQGGGQKKTPSTTQGSMAGGGASAEIPKCPVCDGPMWDNRPKKASGEYSANAPDFKCKKKDCDGKVWPEKEERSDGQQESNPTALLDRYVQSSETIIGLIRKRDPITADNCQKLLDELVKKEDVTPKELQELGGKFAARLKGLETGEVKPAEAPKPEPSSYDDFSADFPEDDDDLPF